MRRTAAPTRFAQNGSSDPHGCLPVVRSSRNFLGSCRPSVARRLPSLVSVGRATPTLSAMHRTAGRPCVKQGMGRTGAARPFAPRRSREQGQSRNRPRVHSICTVTLSVVRSSRNFRSACGPSVDRRLPSLVSVGRATPTLSALHRTAGRPDCWPSRCTVPVRCLPVVRSACGFQKSLWQGSGDFL